MFYTVFLHQGRIADLPVAYLVKDMVEKIKQGRTNMCDEHKSHKRELVCRTCNYQPICTLCLFNGAHKGHDATDASTQDELEKLNIQLNIELKLQRNNYQV